jgi:hypothetical protein
LNGSTQSDVCCLPADHTHVPGGIREFRQESDLNSRLEVGVGEGTKCLSEERVAHEEGGRFTEGDVRGGLSPALCIVIHAGHVIVDKRVGVNEFDCGCDMDEVFRHLGTHSRCCGQCEQGPDSLAACTEWVECCLSERWWPRIDKAGL